MVYKLIKDLTTNNGFEDVIVYEEGTTFKPNDQGLYEFNFDGKIKFLTEEEISKKNNLFAPIQELKIDITETPIEEDDKIKNWRIQLDVKTSLKNLKKIQQFLNDNLYDFLD